MSSSFLTSYQKDLFFSICVNKWIENCGISISLRTFYFDVCSWLFQEYYDTSFDIFYTYFFSSVEEISPKCLNYDVISLDNTHLLNIMEQEKNTFHFIKIFLFIKIKN